MTLRHIILAGGLAIAAWLAIFGDKSNQDDIALPVVRSSSSRLQTGEAHQSPSRASPTNAPSIIALAPREHLIGGAYATEKPVDLFASRDWNPPPPQPKPASLAPPAAPPLPYSYLGKQKQGENWEVFLSRGDSTFIVKKGDVIESQYKVEDIAPPAITLIYLPLNEPQRLAIE